MKNVIMTVKDDVLTIGVDLSRPGEVSKSGKSLVIASTHGNKQVPDTEYKIGLNIYKPNN